MAVLTVQQVSLTGADITSAAAAAGGDTVPNDGLTALRVNNAHSGAWIVTIARSIACNQGFTHSVAVTVSAGTTKFIGPFPRDEFAHILSITYDGVTALTIGAFKL
jgi:hypothetical protein